VELEHWPLITHTAELLLGPSSLAPLL